MIPERHTPSLLPPIPRPVDFVRSLQWLAWIVIIAFAAILPWLVRDWMLREERPPTTPEPEAEAPAPVIAVEAPPVSALPERSTAAKVSDFLRETWLGVRGLHDEIRTTSPHSDRSRAAAARVLPTLEAELAAKGLSPGSPVFLRVFKESSELEIWLEPKPGAEYVHFKTWPICAWSGELGPKLKEGDGQSPEGFYYVPPARMNPQSQFHLSFDLGFPNEYDQHHGRTGSYLMVHGDCVSIGCYAMTDPAIEEIYTLAAAALDGGQAFFRVHAFPFRMTDEKMDTLKEDAKWFDFWSNLKEGYDYFEFLHRPPDVSLTPEGKYQFQ